LRTALAAFEAERSVEVRKIQNAARNSTEWFENVARYTAFEAPQFAYSLLTRSQRISHENLRLRGHDVRIITASHGPQRASEGDILRIGVGFSVPLNGSMGTLTFSPRYLSQVRELLARERFDILHLHEPFVPFLSLFLLRESNSVNIATFHAYAGFSPSYELGSRVMIGHAARLHGRIAVSAAARHFIDRFFPGDYKVIPNGVDIHRLASAQRILAGSAHPMKRFLILVSIISSLAAAGSAAAATPTPTEAPSGRGYRRTAGRSSSASGSSHRS